MERKTKRQCCGDKSKQRSIKEPEGERDSRKKRTLRVVSPGERHSRTPSGSHGRPREEVAMETELSKAPSLQELPSERIVVEMEVVMEGTRDKEPVVTETTAVQKKPHPIPPPVVEKEMSLTEVTGTSSGTQGQEGALEETPEDPKVAGRDGEGGRATTTTARMGQQQQRDKTSGTGRGGGDVVPEDDGTHEGTKRKDVHRANTCVRGDNSNHGTATGGGQKILRGSSGGSQRRGAGASKVESSRREYRGRKSGERPGGAREAAAPGRVRRHRGRRLLPGLLLGRWDERQPVAALHHPAALPGAGPGFFHPLMGDESAGGRARPGHCRRARHRIPAWTPRNRHFDTEAQYSRFWERCREKVRENLRLIEDVVLVPLFRGETKVPPRDIDTWLRRHCRVLQETQQRVDERGYRSNDYRAIIQLDRNPATGGYKHVPKYFFLGADRGTTRYSGQPQACYTCGDWRHKRQDCLAELCSRCGTPGHRTTHCTKPITCSLCAVEGHEYRMCGEAYLNKMYPEDYQRFREGKGTTSPKGPRERRGGREQQKNNNRPEQQQQPLQPPPLPPQRKDKKGGPLKARELRPPCRRELIHSGSFRSHSSPMSVTEGGRAGSSEDERELEEEEKEEDSEKEAEGNVTRKMLNAKQRRKRKRAAERAQTEGAGAQGLNP